MSTVCVDTNIWFYALACPASSDLGKHQSAQNLIASLDRPVITPQILNELAFNLLRKRRWSEADVRLLSSDLLGRCRYIVPSTDWHEKSSLLREQFAVSFWDSLLLDSARTAGCDMLFSEDMQHGLRIGSLEIINPFVNA